MVLAWGIWTAEKPPSVESFRPAWMRQGLCQDHPDVTWFPNKGESTAQAKAICRRCPVIDECLAFALDCGPSLQGVWAATSMRERKHLGKIVSSGDA